jgi:hypothetical protein
MIDNLDINYDVLGDIAFGVGLLHEWLRRCDDVLSEKGYTTDLSYQTTAYVNWLENGIHIRTDAKNLPAGFNADFWNVEKTIRAQMQFMAEKIRDLPVIPKWTPEQVAATLGIAS